MNGSAGAQPNTAPTKPELTVLIEPYHVTVAGAYVQEQIRLRVVLVSPHPFEELKLDLPTIPNARVVTLLQPRAGKLRSYVSGYGYETRLALFPEHSGALTIPSISVSGEIATGPEQREQFRLQEPEIVIPVRIMNPSLASDWWLVSDGIEFAESWQPDPQDFRVGTTIQRRVELTARGVAVEQLPIFEQPAGTGYDVVGVQSTQNTELTKEGLVSRVWKTWELRIRSSDVFYVGPIRIDYWNPLADQAAAAILPAKRVEPLVPDPAAARAALIDAALTAHANRRLGAIVLIAVPGLVAGAILVLFVIIAWPTRADRQLKRRCTRDASPADSLSAVLTWSRESYGLRGGSTLARPRVHLGAGASDAVLHLQESLYGPRAGACDPPRLARRLISSARRQRLNAAWRRLSTPFHRYFAAQRLD